VDRGGMTSGDSTDLNFGIGAFYHDL